MTLTFLLAVACSNNEPTPPTSTPSERGEREGDDDDRGSGGSGSGGSGSSGNADYCYENGWWDCVDYYDPDPAYWGCSGVDSDWYWTGYCDCEAYYGDWYYC